MVRKVDGGKCDARCAGKNTKGVQKWGRILCYFDKSKKYSKKVLTRGDKVCYTMQAVARAAMSHESESKKIFKKIEKST